MDFSGTHQVFFCFLRISRDIFVTTWLCHLENLHPMMLLFLTCAEDEAKMAAIERCTAMKHKNHSVLIAAILLLSFAATPSISMAQPAAERTARPGFFSVLGSIVFTTLHVPFKAVTCAGTQVTSAVAYAGTFGVEGHYDGGTNGRDIGETARRSCTGSWIVRPSQVARDYGE
jgi:hypothetical protein